MNRNVAAAFHCPLIAGCLLLMPLAAHAADAPPVSTTGTNEQDIIRELRITGTVTSPRAAMLSPSVAGLVADIRVDAGDRVARGDVLVELDKELESLALERATATETEARAALDDAQRRLAEAERLGSEKGISESEIKSRRAEMEIRAAALQAATADARRQRARVNRHDIRAPFDGVIGQRTTEVGEWVNPGDELVSLVAMEGLRFDFRAPQEVFPDISRETPATLRLNALPGQDFPGRIQAIVPVSEPGARSFLLRVVPASENVPGAIPGMSVIATLHIDTGRRNVVIPRDALVRYPDGRSTAWVIATENGRTVARERLVRTGLEFSGRVEITEGLEPGMQIVTRGNESLQDGQEVNIGNSSEVTARGN